MFFAQIFEEDPSSFILSMPKKEQTLQGFLDNGALLIQACPTTTRLTLKYKLPKQTDATTPTTAILVAKAFDPVGGVCLKYETNRAAEVGRLILGFQELGQLMQNVPPTVKQKGSSGEEIKGEPMALDEPTVKTEAHVASTSNQTSGGKKKKKGKR